jgi:hypothetical protein
MHRSILVLASAIALNFAATACAGVTALTPNDDDGNPMPGSQEFVTPEDRAREAAAEGPRALRGFVQRTRMIYALNIQDFATAHDGSERSARVARAAADDALRAQKELAEFREQIYRDMLHD